LIGHPDCQRLIDQRTHARIIGRQSLDPVYQLAELVVTPA
jgi:hypothetical protein